MASDPAQPLGPSDGHASMHGSEHDTAYYNAQYNARATVPDHAAIFARWAAEGAAARRAAPAYCDLVYGPAPAERLDYFPAENRGAPLLVFLHGGFWRALDKNDFAWMAAPFNARGVAVAVVNYGLAPATPMEEIVRQCLRASDWLWHHAGTLGFARERMVVSGHSAGGHLGAMLLCAQWEHWASDLPRALYCGAVLVSGLYDLDPVMRSDTLNVDLRLTPERALALSPLFMPPAARVPVITAVGGRETDEFKRQTSIYREAWPDLQRDFVEGWNDHHFSICERLAEPDHPLFEKTVALCRG